MAQTRTSAARTPAPKTPPPPSVFDVLFAGCENYTLPPPWDFVPAHSSYRLLPADREGLLERLIAQFPEEEVLKLKIATRDNDGRLRFCRDFMETQAPIIAIRETTKHPISGLVVEMNYFGTPLLYGEHFVRLARQQSPAGQTIQKIVLAESMADAALFSSCGIVSVPCHSLETLSPAKLRQILDLQHLGCGHEDTADARKWRQKKYFGRYSEEDHQFRMEVTTQIIIAEFKASQPFSSSETAIASLAVVSDLVRLFPDAVWGLSVWRPSATTLAQFAWQVRHDHPSKRVATIQASLSKDCVEIRTLVEPPKSALDLFREAVKHLEVLSLRAAPTTEQTKAWRIAVDRLEEARVQPLCLAAQMTQDPLQRERMYHLAELVRGTLPLMLADSQRLRSEAERRYVSGMGTRHDQQVSALATRDLIQLHRIYSTLTKEIMACQKSRHRPKKTLSSPFGPIGSRFRRSK